MIRRRKIKNVGVLELKGAATHARSGFRFVRSNSRAVLRRAPTRNVSEGGMRALRWYNITGTLRRSLERKLRREAKRPYFRRAVRKSMPLRMRRPSTFVLY